MNGVKLTSWLIGLTMALATASGVYAQDQSPRAGAGAAGGAYLPITIDVDLDAVRGKILQTIRLDKNRQGLPAYLGTGKTSPQKVLANLRQTAPPAQEGEAGGPLPEAPVPPGSDPPPRRKFLERIREKGRLKKLLGKIGEVVAAEIDTEFEYRLWLEKFDLSIDGDVLTGLVEVYYTVRGVPGDMPKAIRVLTDLTGEGTVRVPFSWKLKPGEGGTFQLEGLGGDLHVVGGKGIVRAALKNDLVQQLGFKLLRRRLEKQVEERVPDEFNLPKRLAKMNAPKSLGDNRWLILNLQDVRVGGLQGEAKGHHMALRLAARLEPVILLSKEPPQAPPLPRLSWPKVLPPAPPVGTPLTIRLKIDARSLPDVLPDEAKKETAKYGLDIAQVTFRQQGPPGAERILITAPLEKPVQGLVKVSFTPQLKDNVLSFANPDVDVETPAPKGKDDPVKQTLEELSRQALRTLAVTKLTATKVDFGPHLRKIDNLSPENRPGTGKLRASLANLQIVDLTAQNNQLILTITAQVGPEGIRILEP